MNIKIHSLNTVPVSPGEVYGPRRSQNYSLAWVQEGGSDSRVDRRRFRTRPGSLILTCPGQNLSHRWQKQGPSLQSFVLFGMHGAAKSWPVVRHLPPEALSFQLWNYMAARRVSLPAEEVLAMILKMFREGLDFAVPPAAGSSLPLAVQSALAWLSSTLEKRPTAKPGLAAMASAAGVSPQHLCLLFRKSLKTTPTNCLHALKMERACAMLESSDATLTEIADRLGYSSPYHLSATYKKYYGVAPRDYRRAFREGRRVRPGSLLLRNHPLRRFVFDAKWKLKD